MTVFQRDAAEQHDDIDGIPSPAETDLVVGHEEPRAELAAAARSGRLHHAWLLQGPRGIGKASVAFHFARRLIGAAENETFTDAVPESVFRQIAQSGHPNLLHITRPAGDRGGFHTQITVEEIRRLNHFFHTTAGGRWRVAIVDPAEDMNRNAANALLKILEEPPDRSVFLLVNHQPGRLLPTIRSRCRVLRFEPLGAQEIETALAATETDASAADRSKAAERADGSLRTAHLMLSGGGLELGEEVERLYAGRPDWTAIQKLADALTLKGREAAFELMVEELFRLLAGEAERRLAAGDRRGASKLAAYWQAERARWREAAAYNLDRKQVLLTFFRGLEELRSRATIAS